MSQVTTTNTDETGLDYNSTGETEDYLYKTRKGAVLKGLKLSTKRQAYTRGERSGKDILFCLSSKRQSLRHSCKKERRA